MVERQNGIVLIVIEYKWGVKIMKRGRPKNSKNKKILILDYRTWIIEYDGSAFPSVTFNLRKKGSKHTAYCSTLESALKIMYKEMLADYVNRQNDYGAKFSDLANAINGAKNEILDQININDLDKFLKNDTSENKEV